MKTNIKNAARTVGLAALVLVSSGAVSAYTGDRMAANEKTSSGTITALDAKEKVLKIQGMLFAKSFVLGDNCSLAVGNKADASLGEFRPGQKVTVNYRDADGVLVADRVTQDKLFFMGEVSSIDGKNRTITVRHHGALKSFSIADNCGVTLNAKASGKLDDIKPGSHVTVIYETPNGRWTARWIEEPSQHFTGTLGAINLVDRTVTAGKPLLGDKKFHVGDDCAIVINGKVAGAGHLKDLHSGENCEMSYDTVDGVNIVNRIAPVMAAEKTETSAQTAAPAAAPVARN
jgi:Cu/Ag efflux protein CusF